MRYPIALTVLLCVGSYASAGLHYSGEKFAELPTKWRGFLLDQRALRMIAVEGRPGSASAVIREEYLEARRKLEAKAELTADEAADLGALHVRLGDPEKAVEVLRPAQRQHPEHFRIAANLGTAWQLLGDLPQAEVALRAAVSLAPEEVRPAEELHLKLVRERQRSEEGLDDLFGVDYDGENVAAELPENALAHAQRLGLWLPADGRLLWQLAELAHALGDVRTAANILDGCSNEFGMTDPLLREHRREYRAAVDRIDPDTEQHNPIAWKSDRPLIRELNFSSLPEIRPDRVNMLPWVVLTETQLDRQFRPTFPEYLKKLNDREVALTGFMHPLADELETNYFLFVEYPVGCWFCEAPDVTGMVYAQLPEDETILLKNGLVKIEGRLKLNSTDPEDFLFSLQDARVKEAD